MIWQTTIQNIQRIDYTKDVAIGHQSQLSLFNEIGNFPIQ